MAQLKDEKVCRESMEQWRWNGSPFCPQCNGTKPYKLKDGKTYRCREKTCRKDFTSYCASYINKTATLK